MDIQGLYSFKDNKSSDLLNKKNVEQLLESVLATYNGQTVFSIFDHDNFKLIQILEMIFDNLRKKNDYLNQENPGPTDDKKKEKKDS